MERLERIFLVAAAIMLVAFLAALAYSSVAMGIHLPGHGMAIHYTHEQLLRKVLARTPPFDHPGVRQLAAGKYEVVIVGQTWSFTPGKIRIPAGAEVTFRATSADVIHGFYIPGTRVNLMLIPGEVSEMTYRFSEPGDYLLICHEYCGKLHHTMSATVEVR